LEIKIIPETLMFLCSGPIGIAPAGHKETGDQFADSRKYQGVMVTNLV
jgi:hypothetical protein